MEEKIQMFIYKIEAIVGIEKQSVKKLEGIVDTQDNLTAQQKNVLKKIISELKEIQ